MSESKQEPTVAGSNSTALNSDVNEGRLFFASCFSLIATAAAFAVIGDSMGGMKNEFVLNNAQAGMIGGAAIWGFTLSIIVLGPLCEALGMKRLMWFAFLCHLVGVGVMILAPSGYWGLFTGALIISLGNGTVEAACNPLVATLYPTQKTKKLNQFHVWFPGGIVLGGLASFIIGQVGLDWRAKIAVILIPTFIYGFLLIGQKFPSTERAQSGVSFGDMVKHTLLRPLFILLFICMAMTASLELGPNRWVPAVLESGGIHGILVLVWINGLMAVLRFFAGPIVHRFSPTGVLFGSAILAGVGLLWLSFATTLVIAFAAGTVFALGVCYFWPTMLGVTSERVPKGGELALALMGGVGMLAVGLVTAPLMGQIADRHVPEKLPMAETILLLDEVVDQWTANLESVPQEQRTDYQSAIDASATIIKSSENAEQLPDETPNALRAIMAADGGSDLGKRAGELLGPADNYGGRMSFRAVAPLALILAIIFGALYFNDKRKGGYQAESIHS